MSVTRISSQLFVVGLAFGQCYLWRDGSEVTLIDSGPPGSAPAISSALAELDLPTDAVARVVLTHSHVDHSGSAADVRAWGAQVWVHAGDAPVVRGDVPEPRASLLPSEQALFEQTGAVLPASPPCPVDRVLKDRDELPFGGGAIVVHTPGHTDGSIGVHVPLDRVLFTGDTAAEHEGALILGPFNLDRARAAESFRLLAALDTDIACFGHGTPLVGGAGEQLRAVTDLGPFRG